MATISGIQLSSQVIENTSGPLDAKMMLSTSVRLSLSNVQRWVGMQCYDTDLSLWKQLINEPGTTDTEEGDWITVNQNGKDGVDGVDGVDGIDGTNGIDGKDGKDGVDGKDGINGIDGIDGKDGADGGNAFTTIIPENGSGPNLIAEPSDTLYLVGSGIRVDTEITGGVKIIRFGLISNFTKQCFQIDSTNEDEIVWDIDDNYRNGRVTAVYINGLEQNEGIHYTVSDTGIILTDSSYIQDGDILCIGYPVSEIIINNDGIGDMVIGSTFIVAGDTGDGIGDMIIGDTFIVSGDTGDGIGNMIIGDTFIVN